MADFLDETIDGIRVRCHGKATLDGVAHARCWKPGDILLSHANDDEYFFWVEAQYRERLANAVKPPQ